MAEMRVSYHGPIFVPGLPEAVIHQGVRKVEKDVAEKGAQMVRSNLDHVLRHQTGFYRSHVQGEGDRITDNRVIYGPWLEGTGSRNRTTRFKGYFTFRRTTQELERESGRIATETLRPFVRELN